MKIRDWILFFSPIGLILGTALSWLSKLILEYFMSYFDMSDQTLELFSVGIGLTIWLVFVLENAHEYIIKGKRDYSTTKKDSISRDKQVAMYPVVPKRYLSKTPNDFTIGKYRNRYFRIPIDTNDIKHALIIGSPGSFKSSTLLNALIWNFNFEKER